MRLGKLRYFDKLVLSRKEEGQWTAEGRFVEGTTKDISITGNLQPFVREGSSLKVLPEGLAANDAKSLWTQADIRTVNHHGEEQADSLFLDGEEWVAFRVMEHHHTKMNLHHHEVMFIRRDREAQT